MLQTAKSGLWDEKILFFGFEVLINHGADEIVETEVTLRPAGLRVNGRGVVGFATELALVALLVRFVAGKSLRHNGAVGIGGLHCDVGIGGLHRVVGIGGLLCAVGGGGLHNLFRQAARLTETVDFLQLIALRRIIVPVAGVLDTIGFGRAFVDDSAIFVAVKLAAVNDSVLGECAFDFLYRILINNFCYNENILMY